MARFNTILTDTGATLLTKKLANVEKVNIDSVVIGSGVFEGYKAPIKDVVTPAEVISKISEREFIEGKNDEQGLFNLVVRVSNIGLTKSVPIREIGLYAEGELFAYAWIDGEDSDNILPAPLDISVSDSIHNHHLAFFVTNKHGANIDVSFSVDGLITHKYLNERLEEFEVDSKFTDILEEHIKDKEIHITEDERSRWNRIALIILQLYLA